MNILKRGGAEGSALQCIHYTLRGRIKGAASAISVIQHSLHGGAQYST